MDRFTSRRGVLRGGLALGIGTFLPGAVFAQSGHRGDFPVADNGDVLDQIRHIATAERVIAMTFDDGPHQILTPQVLDILAARQIKASFFVVGNRVAQMPALVARIAQEGHEIGNHSWSHPHMSRMSDHAVLNQIDRTADAVGAATGHRPVLMRPPIWRLHPAAKPNDAHGAQHANDHVVGRSARLAAPRRFRDCRSHHPPCRARCGDINP
jgi:Predicted xylanase/chitin deacetylase